jgi:hypothetical protein
MKHLLAFASVAALLTGYANGESAIEGLRSTKTRGVVSVQADPGLSDGRLVLKVVAFNSTGLPAPFDDTRVKIFTAAGKPVGLLSLQRLIDDVQGATGDRTAATDHQPANYSGPSTSRNAYGQPDVSGYSGANQPTAGVVSPHTRATDGATRADSDPQVQQQIASLKAAILQPLLIEPSTAAGGQIVTEKLKFSRKQPRTLRMVVEFNGEQHEFSFDAPPEQ